MSDAREWLDTHARTSGGRSMLHDALLAVLDLHEQRSFNMGDPWCVHDNEDWPCATVRAIDTALGVTDE